MELIHSTARFGEKYTLSKYGVICAATGDAAVFRRALPSNAVRIHLYISLYKEYQKHLDDLIAVRYGKFADKRKLKSLKFSNPASNLLHKSIPNNQDSDSKYPSENLIFYHL